MFKLVVPQGRSLKVAPSKLAHPIFLWGGLVSPRLRASNNPSDSSSPPPHLLPQGAARLSFTARIERPPFHCGGSASKKDCLAVPRSPLLREQRISTGIIQAILSWGSANKKNSLMGGGIRFTLLVLIDPLLGFLERDHIRLTFRIADLMRLTLNGLHRLSAAY